MEWKRVVTLAAATVLIAAAAYVWWRDVSRHRLDVATIVTNESVWGRQFPLVLRTLPAWREMGEDELTVVGDLVIGRRRPSSEQTPEAVQSRFRELLQRSRGDFSAIAAMFRRYRHELDLPRLAASPFDQSVDVIRVAGGFRLMARIEGILAPRLTASVLASEFGAPEQLRSIASSGSGDRTVTVTEYSYQRGAIRFMTASDEPFVQGRNERLIERVVLGVPSIETAIGQ